MLIAIRSGSAAISRALAVVRPPRVDRAGDRFCFRTEQTSRKLFTVSEMRLHDAAGNRLYLNAEERAAFLAAARRHGGRDRTLCETLHYTGCRPSELLEITPARVDLSGGTIAIRSLKKRRDATGTARIVYRRVPVPPDYLDTLDTAHDLRKAQGSRKRANAPLWPIGRVRVWQIVKGIMIEAGIPDAPCRSPKGLRHGFGIHASVNGVPLNMLQKWMGHAQLSTTAIYADAIGKEEQDIAARMWR